MITLEDKLRELSIGPGGPFYLRLDNAYIKKVLHTDGCLPPGTEDGTQVLIVVRRKGQESRYFLGEDFLQLWEPGVDKAYHPGGKKPGQDW